MTLYAKEVFKAAGMHMRIVYPLPFLIKDVFARYKEIVTIEVAYGDAHKPAPLAFLLRAHTLVDVQSMISEATGRPIRPKVILKRVKEVLSQ